jgi:hypothetical protein
MREGGPMKTVDLRILTTEEFLRLGEISKQKVRRVPKLKVKWAFGNTQVRTNPGKNPPKFEYPKGVDLIWDPNLSEWVKLPKATWNAASSSKTKLKKRNTRVAAKFGSAKNLGPLCI